MHPAHKLILLKGVGYSPEATALFARFTTPPTTQRKGQINALIVALKAAGVWSKLDALYLTAAADNQAGRRNWVADAFNLAAVSAPAFTADRGYQGDGVASYLQTNFNPSTAGGRYALNSASIGVFVRTETNQLYTDLGAEDGTNFALIRARQGGNLVSFANATSSNQTNIAVASSIGLSSWSRTGATTVGYYRNGGSLLTDARVSSAVPASNLTLLARSGSAQFSANQIAAGFIGSGLSAAEQLATYNAISAYLTAIGAA